MQTFPRRRFLRQSLALAGLATFGPSVFAQEKPRTSFGLGFTLYGMKELPLEESLQTCAAVGYDNVELCLLEGYPTEPKLLSATDRTKLRESLAAQKLRVSGLMENFSLMVDDAKQAQQLQRIQAAAQLAHDISPATPPPLETVLGGKPAEWNQSKERLAGRLGEWALAAESANIVIAIKAHIMSAVQTPERLLWLLDNVKSPAIKAAYDYSHFQLQNLALDATLKPLLPHTRFIHVKDGRINAEGKVEFLLPGEGSVDYGALFGQLQNFGYKGDVVVEVSGMIFKQPGYDPKAAAVKSFKALKAGVQKAGLVFSR